MSNNKPSSKIKRGGGSKRAKEAEELKQSASASEKAVEERKQSASEPTQPASVSTQSVVAGKAFDVSQSSIDASNSNAIERLRAMASRREIPSEITGGRDERARLFEEFDRLYDTPPGELGKYSTSVVAGREMQVRFEHEFLSGGVEPRVIIANKVSKASQAEISGATKYAIYQHRPVLEQALMYRQSGWPNGDFVRKYGRKGERVFSDSQKARIDQEIRSYIEGQFKLPLSQRGQELAETYWRREKGGWVREG